MLEFQISTIVFTVLDLLILYVLLKKLLFGRVNKVLQQRAALIQEKLDSAEEKRVQADRLKTEYEDRLAKAQAEASSILSQAQARGEREYQTIFSQAQEDVRRMQAQAKARNEADREEMLRAARREVAQLAVLAASKVTQKALDEDADRAILEDFLAEANKRK